MKLFLKPFILLALTEVGQAVNFSELNNGEFSADRLTPTNIQLDSGRNTISGRVGTLGGLTDLDYFTISIPSNFQLETVFLLAYINNAQDGNVSFWAIDDGDTFSVAPENASAQLSDFLGWSHLGDVPPDDNLLLELASGTGAAGFTTPLPSGDYTFWVQETGTGDVDYGLEFNVTPVPEPTTMLSLALTAFALFRRQRSH